MLGSFNTMELWELVKSEAVVRSAQQPSVLLLNYLYNVKYLSEHRKICEFTVLNYLNLIHSVKNYLQRCKTLFFYIFHSGALSLQCGP